MPTAEAYNLGPWQLALAAGFLLVAGGVSLLLGLRMEKRIGLAAIRTVTQLLAIGFVLDTIFRLRNIAVVLLIVSVMIAIASHTAVRRPTRTFRGAGWLAFISLIITALLVTWTVTGVVIGVQPWWEPRFMIPLLGMVLGNSLTGISLCLDHFLETLSERRGLVEMELAHGASRWEAVRDPMAEAVRRGMIPILNTMMVVGLVSLPGMMTGQILAGAKPFSAVKYQIVVMFMMAAAVSLGSTLLALLAYHRLFNEQHQLRAEIILKQTG